MSSLRVETLRLCWLEAFLTVANEENISEAANVLGIDQSTVSRYMQRLEKWVGKKLIEPGTISDLDNPRVSIGITEAGRRLYDKAEKIVADIHQLRDESTRRSEIVESVDQIISQLKIDRNKQDLQDLTGEIRNNIDMFQNILDNINNNEMPMNFLISFNRNLRSFFNTYEVMRNRERRRQRALRKAGSSARDLKIFRPEDDTAKNGMP